MSFQKHQILTGTVHSHQPFGVFLQLYDVNFGLLKIPDFPESSPYREGDWPPLGHTMRCVVLDVVETPEGYQITLSARESDLKTGSAQ